MDVQQAHIALNDQESTNFGLYQVYVMYPIKYPVYMLLCTDCINQMDNFIIRYRLGYL